MKITELIGNILRESQNLGTFDLESLLQFSNTRRINGIAVARWDGQELYLAILEGEPEGAVYVDEKGILFGDKAVLMSGGKEMFDLAEVRADIVEALMMSSRIFDKNRLKKNLSYKVPEIKVTGSRIGNISVTVIKDGAPQNGIRVSIRKDGKILASDTTTLDGTARFRIEYGDYDCILQDKALQILKYSVTFDESHLSVCLEI
ncbi:MAG: hypothetical protein A4E35_01196 [Methanoregula sp. PtaU1.Bin051]|nr:MAG: hypothetical protein A4E35_01196 [Methanoregula sp. PtaU1.Bin051]